MRINHNIAALNTYRQLTGNTGATSKSLEKLSSGLRINKAGDDAAGLAISEKMRGQIRGLDMASKNAQDGISLISTAEGALNETHSILQRMRELAVQSANDTNTTEDRSEMQKEINQLVSEIDRIGRDTEFNTKKLLNGEAGVSVQASSDAVKDLSGTADTKAGTINITAAKTDLAVAASFSDNAYKDLSLTDTLTAASAITLNGTSFSFTDSQTVQDALDAFNEKASTTGVTASFDGTNGFTFTAVNAGASHQITWSGGTGAFATTTAGVTDNGTNAAMDVSELGGSYSASGNRITVTSGNYQGLEFTLVADADVAIVVGTNNALKMQIGANATQNMSIGINDMRADALGIKGIDISSQTTADAALTTIQNAIDKVSSERSKMGAYQNRLEHTINNLGTSSENLSAAESRIRDVDMAKEMMEFTKNNILSQAAQAMLAQANQQPQSVLQLLQ